MNKTIDTTYNGAIPSFPQALQTVIEYTDTPILVDLSLQLTQGKIAGIQTIFVDLMGHDSDVSILMPDTSQRIVAKANTQGYYPVLSTNLMRFEIKTDLAGTFPIQFINFPIAAAVWGFNVIKGDKGEQGEAGGTVITVNSNSDGISIAEINADEITLKKLVAGENIELNEVGETIVISSTASGGGGGQTTSNYQTETGVPIADIEGDSVELKNLIAGNGIAFTEVGGGIQINTTGGGGGAGEKLNSISLLWFGGATQAGVPFDQSVGEYSIVDDIYAGDVFTVTNGDIVINGIGNYLITAKLLNGATSGNNFISLKRTIGPDELEPLNTLTPCFETTPLIKNTRGLLNELIFISENEFKINFSVCNTAVDILEYLFEVTLIKLN